MQSHESLSRRDFFERGASATALVALCTFLPDCRWLGQGHEASTTGGERMLILLGGGDGGGFNIVDGQVHLIPPLGPELVEYLRTLGHLVRLGEVEAKADVVAEAQQTARSFLRHLSTFEKADGVIITEGRVADFAFADVDGGFWSAETTDGSSYRFHQDPS